MNWYSSTVYCVVRQEKNKQMRRRKNIVERKKAGSCREEGECMCICLSAPVWSIPLFCRESLPPPPPPLRVGGLASAATIATKQRTITIIHGWLYRLSDQLNKIMWSKFLRFISCLYFFCYTTYVQWLYCIMFCYCRYE